MKPNQSKKMDLAELGEKMFARKNELMAEIDGD